MNSVFIRTYMYVCTFLINTQSKTQNPHLCLCVPMYCKRNTFAKNKKWGGEHLCRKAPPPLKKKGSVVCLYCCKRGHIN